MSHLEKMDYLCNCKSEIRAICNAVENHRLQAMKVVPRHASGHFDWLIHGCQGVNPSREAISVLPRKYKRFTFVHLVTDNKNKMRSKRESQVFFIVKIIVIRK